MVPLSINLGIIFFMNLTVNNAIEAAMPFVMNWFKKKSETQGLNLLLPLSPAPSRCLSVCLSVSCLSLSLSLTLSHSLRGIRNQFDETLTS
jgi:hypothetical protein